MEQRRRLGLTIAVAGACGGLGTSCLAVALATRSALAGHSSALIDLDLGGGADVLLGCEAEPGPRWRDLLGAAGSVDAEALLSRLPRSAEGVAVLSGDRGFVTVPEDLVDAVRPALAAAVDVLVVDLGRSAPRWSAEADALLLVVGGSVPALTAAQVACDRLVQLGGRPVLVLREVDDRWLEPVSEALAAPVLTRLRRERQIGQDLEFGRSPGARDRSALARAADEVLRVVLADGEAA